MITLHKANGAARASDTIRINIDHIIALQRQTSVQTNDFTAVIILGAPAYDAIETEEQIMVLIEAARGARNATV